MFKKDTKGALTLYFKDGGRLFCGEGTLKDEYVFETNKGDTFIWNANNISVVCFKEDTQ